MTFFGCQLLVYSAIFLVTSITIYVYYIKPQLCAKHVSFCFSEPYPKKSYIYIIKKFWNPGLLLHPCVMSLKLLKKLDVEVFLHTQKVFLHTWGIFDLREIIESRYSLREIFISWKSLSAARQSNWNTVWQVRFFRFVLFM